MKRFITHHRIKPDALVAYLEATLAMVAEARRSPGVHTMELLRRTDSPVRFHLLEIYLRDSAYEDHRQSPHYRTWRDALEKQDLLAAEETRVPVEPVRPEDLEPPECGPDSIVTLREIDNKNVGAVLALQVTEYQDQFVARNTRSLRQALELVVNHVRTLPNATELLLSYVPGEGSPQPFYEKGGFRDTGVRHGSEFEMRLILPSVPG